MVAEILFLGLLMFCDMDGPKVCSGHEISDGSPVRALVLDLSETGYNCSELSGMCDVCSGKQVGFHEPWLIFEEQDIKDGMSCAEVGTNRCPQPYGDFCCLNITGKKITVRTDESDLDVWERPNNLIVPPNPKDKKHPFGWVAQMTYFEAGLTLKAANYLEPGVKGPGDNGARVATWVDLNDGMLSSTIMTRGELPNSNYVPWYPFPFQDGEPGTALAEAVLWEEPTATFKLSFAGGQEIQFESGKVRLVIANLPSLPLQRVTRNPGSYLSEHFKAYYNIFENPGDCRQPLRLPGTRYFTGGTDLVNWLRDRGLELKTWGVQPTAAGISGDNSVCSPSKFP